MGKMEQTLSQFLMFIILIGWTQGEKNAIKYYSSSYGILCDDTCGTHEQNYYWCNTKMGWDYCSPEENTDYTGQPCREDHPCGKYGTSYHWCYTKGDSWGYCGLLRDTSEPKTRLYIGASLMNACWDACLYDEGKKFFWCHTDEGWDYCSPLPDVTYKNEPCRLDHYCGTHNYSYTWCFTNSSYDYCGRISDGECTYITPKTNKKDINTGISCTWKDAKNEKQIKFNLEPELTISSEGSTWKNEIINFIARWKNTYLNPQASSKLITSDNLRFEVQKLVNEEGEQYYNLQIVVNVHAQNGRSTKLAQVHIPEYGVPDRFVQLAFVESFWHHARISLKINESIYS